MQVDVELEDVTAAKEQVMGAIFPRATQMDFNIGAALWLAAPVACLYAPCVLMYASASYVCHIYMCICTHIYMYTYIYIYIGRARLTSHVCVSQGTCMHRVSVCMQHRCPNS